MLIFTVEGLAADGKANFSFTRVDYQKGLSNSAVLCLFQDNRGLMWFGTYDGVNCFDGQSMEVFRSDFSEQEPLSNNIIHSIQQADRNCLWISTHLGLNRFSQESSQVVQKFDLQGDYYLHSNISGNTWLVSCDGLYYYNTIHQDFVRIQGAEVPLEEMDTHAFVTNDGTLWTFPCEKNRLVQYTLNGFDKDSLSVRLSVSSSDFHHRVIEQVFYQNGVVCFMDDAQDLYIYSISGRSKIFIRNLSSLCQRYGKIVGIVPFGEDIMVAFRSNGLVRLCSSKKYEEEMVTSNIRIFGIYRDSRQNILWIGTDGQGAILYADKYAITKNLMLNKLSPDLHRQIRSIMTDSMGGLWMGTKGDGLIHLPDYEKGENQAEVLSFSGRQPASAYKLWESEFCVYSLLQSRYNNGFWISSGNQGLFYYSFADRTINQVQDCIEDPLGGIHGIYEESDTTLYAIAEDRGFRKLLLEKKGGKIYLKSQKKYRFFHNQQEITMFYPLLAEGDSIFWLGSRQKGLVRFDRRTEEYWVLSLKEILHKSVDDVLSLHRAHDGKLYVGTTSGLVCLDFATKPTTSYFIGKEHGLLNDMIHGILEDRYGLLWLSTNRGLIKYNPQNHTFHTYYYTAGIQVGEFSDDAYYACPYTGRLFFGGIDGLAYLDKEVVATSEFNPDVVLRKMVVNGKKVILEDFLSADGQTFSIEGKKASFSFSFAVPDYLSCENMEYSYKLEGYDKDWSPFSSVNELSYENVPSGDYQLCIRYKKDVFSTEYTVFSAPLSIVSPWYISSHALSLYMVLFVLAILYLIHLLHEHLRQQRTMRKLLTVENNHELPAINIPKRDLLNCFAALYRSYDQLRAEKISYAERLKILEQVREMMLTALFRQGTLSKSELGHIFPKEYSITGQINMQELSQEVMDVLQGQGVNLDFLSPAIPDRFVFQVYKNALRSMLYGCYLFLAERGDSSEVTVTMRPDQGSMLLQFSSASNPGVGELFQYLSDPDLFLKMSGKMGSMEEAVFSWELFGFMRSALEQHHATLNYSSDNDVVSLSILFVPAPVATKEESGKKTILLLEDREEMVWLISDLLSEEFIVRPVKSIQLALKEVAELAPALFLVDLQVYADAEEEFMKCIANNRVQLEKTAFVPMLSWKACSLTLREILLWSDSYVVLPYDMLFLRAIVHRVVYGKRQAKIYVEDLGYLSDQVVCTTSEQKEFVCKLLQVIEQNLHREDLGSTLIATSMAMSSSQFYRKFKEIFLISPSELIKDYRMEKAARLLQDEKLSIQDVMFDVGISSRSYFYKEFSRRFGTTPKLYRNSKTATDEADGRETSSEES